MGAEQEARATNLFLTIASVTLVAILLELIWGAQWRWLATTAIVGVAVAVAIPLSDRVRRPHVIQLAASGDVDPDAWSQVMAAPAGVAPERKPFPIPVQPINPTTWEPGQRRPEDRYFANEVEPAPQPEPPPTPPRSFSPVADPAGETLRWPRRTGDSM